MADPQRNLNYKEKFKMAVSKKSETIIVLPGIEFKTMQIRIVGETPLVTHPFPLKAMRQIEEKQQAVAKTKKHDIRNPAEDFITSLYWLTPPPTEFTQEAFDQAVANGARFGFHSGGLKQSATMAAVRRGIVKNAPTARGLFHVINTDQDLIYGKDCIEIHSEEPPKMRVDCLSTFSSGADMRYRPQFDKWWAQFTVKYDAGMISPEQILTWFKLGGFSCGLGENRAEKGEGWGSYSIKGVAQ
jgi:hypothetical protein